MPTGFYLRTKYHRDCLKVPHKGSGIYKRKPFTEEHIKHMGHSQTEETREKIRNNHKPEFHTEETKEKQRIARLKQILPVIDTSIELKVKDYLEEKKIKYIHPWNLGDKFQCDFYLPLSNLIVECDGTYWHSREDMKKRDKAKDAYAKKCGFRMLRLTEKQINQGRFQIIN